MKAIIITKRGAYRKHYGKTFDIKDVLSYGVSLKGVNPEFPENSVDFTFDEVLIVDIDEILKEAECQKVALNLTKYLERL